MVEEFVEEVGAEADDALEVVRELARRAYADAIPELIDGASVAEIMGSVEAARAAYSRVFADVSASQEAVRSAPPVVPAGGSSARVVDVDRLPAAEKLRLGVKAVRR